MVHRAASVLSLCLLLAACGGSVTPDQGGGVGNDKGTSGPTPSPTAKAVACPQPVQDFMAALEDLDSRLSVGLNFADYGTKVGDVKVVYDKVDASKLSVDCVTDVGTPAEAALNDYIDAYNTWNDCIGTSGCTNDSIKSKLQAKWADATDKIGEAKKALAP